MAVNALNAEALLPNLYAFLLAFLTVLLLGPRVIVWLRLLKFGQNINLDAPERHRQKQGTPSMGGVLMVFGVIAALLAGALLSQSLRPFSPQLLSVVIVFVAHALLGFADDYLKAKRGKSLGLRAREKMAGQVIISAAFVYWLYAQRENDFTTEVAIWRGVTVDLGYAYYMLAFLLMIGLSNAANFTDGLDGLAAGISIFIALGLAWTVHPDDISALPQLPLFGYALAGSCLGFLWYNAHPAKVFMGDTGSLAIGASLTALGLIGKQELLLLIFAAVFLLEIVSVIIQVSVFKWTKRSRPDGTGRRIFKMTPLHHHFELSGWDETQVVTRFWILGILALALGLLCAPALSFWIGG